MIIKITLFNFHFYLDSVAESIFWILNISCGDCVDRCPMLAISLENSTASISRDRCIGCGNCIISCEPEAISLQIREKEYIPFDSMEELYAKILERREIIKKREEKKKIKKKIVSYICNLREITVLKLKNNINLHFIY